MNTTTYANLAQPCGNGTSTGVSLPIFGGFAMLPSIAASVVRDRHDGEAMTARKRTQGTQVWSPPT